MIPIFIQTTNHVLDVSKINYIEKCLEQVKIHFSSGEFLLMENEEADMLMIGMGDVGRSVGPPPLRTFRCKGA